MGSVNAKKVTTGANFEVDVPPLYGNLLQFLRHLFHLLLIYYNFFINFY
jgi:hypothetical protein